MQVETSRCPYLRTVLMALVIATAYCITGKLGLLLAIPPRYATAIWPPSGIALAATLIYGYGVWPGIVLGSVLANIGTALEMTSVAALLKSVGLATSIGMGAALQAVVGAYLVRRYVGFPSALAREREIGAFLVLGGPLSCLVNATIGVTTLRLGGKIPWALTPLSWWTWWVGDTIGVLIVTPLVLSWVAEPRQSWRRRRLALTLALVGAFALAVIFFVHTSGRERERLRLVFERQTETIARTLQDRLNDYLGVLYAIKSFFTSTPGVTRQEFHTFVQGMFVRHPGLQEPLRGVAGCVQLLEQYYGAQLDTRAHEFIAHAVAGVTRMQTLICDLLTYSRVRTLEQPFEPVDCALLLQDVLANLAVAIHENHICIRHEALPTVMAEPTQLLQVFQNLLGNAIKFRSAQPPAIHIGAARHNGTWVFSVRDNGIGIAPQYAERIFVMFQRLHTRNRYPGTGIGLALCKKIVERHGGRIWVESEPGTGATFVFTIPERGPG
jgi:signal transduction histidine kinase